MKKIRLLILFAICFIVGNVVDASSVSVRVSSNSITKGGSVTVTATINADSGIYTTEGSLICTGAGVNKSADMSYEDLNTANTSKSFSFTIKPTTSGTVTCSTSNVMIRELKEASRYSLSNGSASITVSEPVYVPPKVYSSNNKLKSLGIEGYNITPQFSNDIKEYNIEVPNGTTSVVVTASKDDNSASISGIGEISVNEGVNKIEVKVTAENGNVNTFVINVNVKELDPIEIKVDGKKYTIVRKEGILELLENYEKSSIKLGEEDVLCYKNIVTGNILVGLKDEEGNSKYYSYDEEKNKYTIYNGKKIGGININILEMPSKELPNGYSKVTLEYNDDKIEAYQYIEKGVTYAADDSTKGNDFYLLYAVNEMNGEKGLYVYDKLEGTIQRFNTNLFMAYQEKVDSYFLYLLIAILILAVSIITFILLLIKKKGNHKHKFS